MDGSFPRSSVGTWLRRSSVTMLIEESGHKLPPATPLQHQLPLPAAGSADRDQPGRVRDHERAATSRATVDGAKASHGAGKKRTPERPRPRSHAGAWERSKKGGCVPRTIRVRPEDRAMPSRCSPWGSTWTGVGRRWPASVPGRQVGRGAHGCCGFGRPSYFFRKSGKKSGISLFFSFIPVC